MFVLSTVVYIHYFTANPELLLLLRAYVMGQQSCRKMIKAQYIQT